MPYLQLLVGMVRPVPLSHLCRKPHASESSPLLKQQALIFGSLGLIPVTTAGPRPTPPEAQPEGEGVRAPMEPHSPYRGQDWTPQRLMFHQNLESFAERVGLVVGLQSNGKVSQEQAYAEIRRIWKDLKDSKDVLLKTQKDGS